MNNSDSKSLITLEKTLKSGKTKLTVGDAASHSALDLDDAKRSLDALLGKYQSKLLVTENGDLIYDFGQKLTLRGAKSLADYWGEIKDWGWKAFKFLFRIWLTVTLLVYFLIFLAIMIAMIVASLSSDSDDDGDRGFGGGSFFTWYLIADLFSDLFRRNHTTARTIYHTDDRGYTYRTYEPRYMTTKGGKQKKGFVSSVYDYVFGPKRFEPSPDDNYKELASFLRQQKGIVTPAETVKLAGFTSEQASDFLAESVARFNGKAEVTDNGVLYAEFEELTRRASESKQDHPIEFYWNEYEAPYEQNGNSSGRNGLIIMMGVVNLLAGLFFATEGHFEFFNLPLEMLDATTAWLGYVPLAFSSFFFGIPIVRKIRNGKKNAQIRLNNIRKRLMKVIFEARSGKVTAEELEKAVNRSEKGEEKLDRKLIEATMENLIYDLQGDLSVTEEGQLVYSFEKLQTELATAIQLRRGRQSTDSLGEVVFDSGQ